MTEEQKKEYEPTQEEQVKLAKIKIGTENKMIFETEYKDPESNLGDAITIEMELHQQTIKDELKITILQDKLLDGRKDNDDLNFTTRIIATLDTLCDKIFLTIDNEKFIFEDRFWDLLQKFDMVQAYKEIILPCYTAYVKFVSEQKMDFATLKKSLKRETNK